VTEDLASPLTSDQVIVPNDSAVCMKLNSMLQSDHEMLVAQPHQLNEIAFLCEAAFRWNQISALFIFVPLPGSDSATLQEKEPEL